MTGYNTRSKYMRRKVNLSTFSSYPALLQILSSTEDMFHEVERDVRMASAVSNMKLDIEPQKTTSSSSAHVLAPVVHIPAGDSSTPVHTATTPPKFRSPHLTPSNSSTVAASFPASVLWTTEDQAAANIAYTKNIDTTSAMKAKASPTWWGLHRREQALHFVT